MTGASGGDAAAASFMLSASPTLVLGFSMAGFTIPASNGLCSLFGNASKLIVLPDISNIENSEIPVLGKIAAGTPIEAIQNEVSRIPMPANIEKNCEYFGL